MSPSSQTATDGRNSTNLSELCEVSRQNRCRVNADAYYPFPTGMQVRQTAAAQTRCRPPDLPRYRAEGLVWRWNSGRRTRSHWRTQPERSRLRRNYRTRPRPEASTETRTQTGAAATRSRARGAHRSDRSDHRGVWPQVGRERSKPSYSPLVSGASRSRDRSPTGLSLRSTERLVRGLAPLDLLARVDPHHRCQDLRTQPEIAPYDSLPV